LPLPKYINRDSVPGEIFKNVLKDGSTPQSTTPPSGNNRSAASAHVAGSLNAGQLYVSTKQAKVQWQRPHIRSHTGIRIPATMLCFGVAVPSDPPGLPSHEVSFAGPSAAAIGERIADLSQTSRGVRKVPDPETVVVRKTIYPTVRPPEHWVTVTPSDLEKSLKNSGQKSAQNCSLRKFIPRCRHPFGFRACRARPRSTRNYGLPSVRCSR
jgi:hypothetical protein